MRIGSILENQNFEKRIAITPEIIKKYTSLGFEINLCENYGAHLGFRDEEYINLGVKILRDENEILEYGIEKLKKNNSVNIIGDPKKRGSVMSFTIKGIHPHDIATILDEDGVAIRAGHHCCQIFHDKIGIPATARASIGVYNSKEDIDILCNAINNCKKVFNI